MTEAEWLACTDAEPMLEFLRGKASDRKLRLFACACCRMVRHLLVPEACEALEVAERIAESSAGSAERRRAREIACHVGWVSDPSTAHRRGPAKAAVCDALARRGWEAAAGAVRRTVHIGTLEKYHSQGNNWTAARNRQADFLAGLLRCLLGNPFRPVNVDPSWLAWNNNTVSKLAKSIYNELAFDNLPILADALEDAGCIDSSILNHCRQPGEHARGCWVLDMLLAKE